jgi:hypothetical protein
MAGTFCLGDFLGTIFAETFAVRFFCVLDLAAFLAAGLTLAFLRFGAFLRVALRFFALAMRVSCEVGCRLTNFEAMQFRQHYPSRIRRATLVDVQLGRSRHARLSLREVTPTITIQSGRTGRWTWMRPLRENRVTRYSRWASSPLCSDLGFRYTRHERSSDACVGQVKQPEIFKALRCRPRPPDCRWGGHFTNTD